MFRFQIIAQTQAGESIGLVGSTPELGQWDVTRCIRLRTNRDRYPLWWTDTDIDLPSSETGDRAEYKYVRFSASGAVEWEAWGSNRWLPLASGSQAQTLLVDDGAFGYVQPYPFGYIQEPTADTPPTQPPAGLKVLVIGSSVAVGHKAWLLEGWAWQLGQTLQSKYGHRLVNVSQVGANVGSTIARFASVVPPEQPDIVIIALSLGNEGLASCRPHERRAIQRRFESGLQQLIKMTRALGARPILGSVYPHGDYRQEHDWLLRDTHNRMLTWGIPMLDWLGVLDDGQGRWKPGISFDPAHPNTMGHRLMYGAIDLTLFQTDKAAIAAEIQRLRQPNAVAVYQDDTGFQITAQISEQQVRIQNPSSYPYTIAPYWRAIQTALKTSAGLMPGIYMAKYAQPGITSSFAVGQDGTIASTLEIPPGADLEYTSTLHLFSPHNAHLLFYDGHLGIVKTDDHHLWVINESDHEFNIHPMWREVRSVLKALPEGVYTDPLQPDTPFRTLMVGKDGLESRVKAPPQSAICFQYQCKLSDISRVAIIPLGDRCAVRMMLYKMEYDGPAFPFDLTRTTNISDIADMIESRFYDMWNPALLHYSQEAGRIYHRKWSGLSFAHEVEDTDDPLHNMGPVYERMRSRYSARAERFWYTVQHCDKALFIRTGGGDRGGVMDLVSKLEKHCQGKPFHLLILSLQDSQEFADLPNVSHCCVEFNPDRMYADPEHWLYCTNIMRGILESLGISSQNLFWCPPNPPKPSPNS